MKIGFIGVGNLASALIGGMCRGGNYNFSDFILLDRFPEKLISFTRRGAGQAYNESDLVRQSGMVVIAIKPADFETTLAAMNNCCDFTDKIFVSPAAAISTGYIRRGLGGGAKVVRTMPSTPLALGYGATAVCAGEGVSGQELEKVRAMFDSCGITAVLPEEQMNAVIAVNGSSPAYVYYMAEVMTAWAREKGLDERTALEFTAQTFIGAARMMLGEQTPQQLRAAVCSPGGTTFEALRVMRESDFAGMMAAAMDACTAQAGKMGR